MSGDDPVDVYAEAWRLADTPERRTLILTHAAERGETLIAYHGLIRYSYGRQAQLDVLLHPPPPDGDA